MEEPIRNSHSKAVLQYEYTDEISAISAALISLYLFQKKFKKNKISISNSTFILKTKEERIEARFDFPKSKGVPFPRAIHTTTNLAAFAAALFSTRELRNINGIKVQISETAKRYFEVKINGFEILRCCYNTTDIYTSYSRLRQIWTNVISNEAAPNSLHERKTAAYGCMFARILGTTQIPKDIKTMTGHTDEPLVLPGYVPMFENVVFHRVNKSSGKANSGNAFCNDTRYDHDD